MSSTLNTKSQTIVNDLVKGLGQRIGIRYIIFSDEYRGPHCTAFLFGTTNTPGTFFWLTCPSLTSSVEGHFKFDIWEHGGVEKLTEKFSEWEAKGKGYPWWGKLVSPRLFKCIRVFNIDDRLTLDLDENNHQLYFFHGLLAARLNAHLVTLKDMVGKEPTLRPRVEAFGAMTRRFRGFADQAYDREFWKKD